MCWFMNFELHLRQGQLPCVVNGTNYRDTVWSINVYSARWFFGTQPGFGSRTWYIKNYLLYQVGYVFLQNNSIWACECQSNLSVHHKHFLLGNYQTSIVVYLDDVIVFSRKWLDHICHLKNIFEWCQKYRISLNLKKIIFPVSKGNLLGHIITRSWIKVDLDQVWMIT